MGAFILMGLLGFPLFTWVSHRIRKYQEFGIMLLLLEMGILHLLGNLFIKMMTVFYEMLYIMQYKLGTGDYSGGYDYKIFIYIFIDWGFIILVSIFKRITIKKAMQKYGEIK